MRPKKNRCSWCSRDVDIYRGHYLEWDGQEFRRIHTRCKTERALHEAQRARAVVQRGTAVRVVL